MNLDTQQLRYFFKKHGSDKIDCFLDSDDLIKYSLFKAHCQTVISKLKFLIPYNW